MHQKLIEDLCRLLGTTEEVVFCGAKRRRTGMVTPAFTEQALNDLGNFRRTGTVPEYVEWYALYYLGSVVSHTKATRKCDPLEAQDASLVTSLFDNDTA